MQHPMFYVSALQKAIEDIAYDAGTEYEMHGENDRVVHLDELRQEAEELMEDWKQYAFAGGPLMLRTWQLIGREIDEWPWNEPSHPAFARMRDNMMRNDVT